MYQIRKERFSAKDQEERADTFAQLSKRGSMVITNYHYTMKEASSVAKQASSDIEMWLRKKSEAIAVINVEDDADYREKDIDLIYKYRGKNGEEITTTIEIKGDRWHSTGNYFFETISNDSKQTPGCFLYSEAEYLFYYFVEIRELHIIPMLTARQWFTANMEMFAEKKTMTPLKNGAHYNTVGRLVPIGTLQKAILRVKVIRIVTSEVAP
jgi:hypothetical protein